MKLLRVFTAGIFFSCSVWIASYYWAETIKANAVEETKQVELIALAKWFDAEKSKQETMQAHIALESKRTNVNNEMRKIILAEMKKCRKNKC